MTIPSWITHLVEVNEKKNPLSMYAVNAEGNVFVSMSQKPLLKASLCPLIDTHTHRIDLLHFSTIVSSAVVLLSNYKNRSYFSACGFIGCFHVLNFTHWGSVCVGVKIVKQVKLCMPTVTELLFCLQLFTLKWPYSAAQGEHAVTIVTTSSPLSD